MLVYVAYWPHPYQKACHQQLKFRVTSQLSLLMELPKYRESPALRSMELDGTTACTDLPPEAG